MEPVQGPYHQLKEAGVEWEERLWEQDLDLWPERFVTSRRMVVDLEAEEGEACQAPTLTAKRIGSELT